MEKYTQKQLKSLVAEGIAIDITYGTNETRNKIIKKEGFYNQIGYAAGVYGCSGMLLKGNKTGTLYAITGRTTAIFIF